MPLRWLFARKANAVLPFRPRLEALETRDVPTVSFFATGADAGGGPHVQIFNAAGDVVGAFMAYDHHFSGGVQVAAADLDHDGKADIITGAGPGGGPHVKVFSGANLAVLQSFMAYDQSFAGGVYVAAGDFNGDGTADVVTGPGQGM